jgi:hypothetical protein
MLEHGPVEHVRRRRFGVRVARWKMRSETAWIVSLCLLTACSSMDFLSGGVRVTRDQKEVAGCRLLGNVTSRQGKRDLKLQARELGGNVVYVVSGSVSAAGGAPETAAMVYLCSSG